MRSATHPCQSAPTAPKRPPSGGSTAWKLGTHARALVAEAKARGKRVHMGRVNSARRWRYAEHIGCDSCDGTYLTFGPDVNLPRLLAWQRTPLPLGERAS